MKQCLQMLDRLVFGKVNNKNAIDKNLKFKEHILKLYKKARRKRSALVRICNTLNQERQIKSVHRITIWLLPFNLDVFWKKLE